MTYLKIQNAEHDERKKELGEEGGDVLVPEHEDRIASEHRLNHQLHWFVLGVKVNLPLPKPDCVVSDTEEHNDSDSDEGTVPGAVGVDHEGVADCEITVDSDGNEEPDRHRLEHDGHWIQVDHGHGSHGNRDPFLKLRAGKDWDR